MGTNYYIQQKTTLTEEKVLTKFKVALPQIHIGKASGGWSFTFHGVDKYELQDMDVEEVASIESYKDWLKVLEVDKYDIINEYGELSSVSDFKELVESKRGAEFNHTTECLKDSRDSEYAEEHCWLDEEGNSFTKGEFS
jgi:hypothetical protein